MAARWRSFVILSDMRSGSNVLEHSLNSADGITCWGELCNPSAAPQEAPRIGDLAAQGDGLHGFRLFPEHDEAVLAAVLADQRCAKVILRRNPLDRYLSLSLARASDQWTWVAAQEGRPTQVPFEMEGFQAQLDEEARVWNDILDQLRVSGQAGYFLDYQDVGRPEIIAGLLRFLGAPEQELTLRGHFKPQNPSTAYDKVTNPQEMRAALAAMDPWQMAQKTARPTYPLIATPWPVQQRWGDVQFQPIPHATRPHVLPWVEHLFSGPPSYEIQLRFTIVPDPLERAYDVFCQSILGWGAQDMPSIRARLNKNHGFSLPDPSQRLSLAAQQAAFGQFLRFLGLNLRGQTAMKIRPNWMPMAQIAAQMKEQAPRFIAREHEMVALAALVGGRVKELAVPSPVPHDAALDFSTVITPEHHRLCRAAYEEDYEWLGLSSVRKGG